GEAPICVGGSQQLAQGLRNAIEAAGGVVQTGMDVKRILMRGNRAVGVEMADGTRVGAAKAVVANVEPKKTFLNMVGEEFLPSTFVTRVKNYHARGRSLFTLHLALSEPPKYRAAANNPPVNLGFSQEMFGGTIQDQVRAYQEIAAGRPVRNEMLQVPVPTLYDPSQAPAGKHTAVVWQFAPFNVAPDGPEGWKKLRDEYAEHIMGRWRSYAPNMTPDGMGYFRPFAGWSNYRSPVEGLYMCGGFCHPGGGVHAGGGHNAAGVIAEDYKLNKWWDYGAPECLVAKPPSPSTPRRGNCGNSSATSNRSAPAS